MISYTSSKRKSSSKVGSLRKKDSVVSVILSARDVAPTFSVVVDNAASSLEDQLRTFTEDRSDNLHEYHIKQAHAPVATHSVYYDIFADMYVHCYSLTCLVEAWQKVVVQEESSE